jgi:hypothetical protein
MFPLVLTLQLVVNALNASRSGCHARAKPGHTPIFHSVSHPNYGYHTLAECWKRHEASDFDAPTEHRELELHLKLSHRAEYV